MRITIDIETFSTTWKVFYALVNYFLQLQIPNIILESHSYIIYLVKS